MPKRTNEDLLIDAAAEVFAERGYDGAGVAEIARRAGVTTGAIYSRYSGKSELLLEALNRSFELHMNEIIALATDGAELSDSDGNILSAHQIGYNTPNVSGAHDALFLEAVVASSRDDEIAEMLFRRLENAAMYVNKFVEEGKADKRIHSSLDSDALKTYVMAMSMGFSILRSVNHKMPESSDWQTLLDQIQNSFSKPPGEK